MARILMISAQSAARSLARERLGPRGHVLRFARDPGAAARLLREKRFDLVLLDGKPSRGKARIRRGGPATPRARVLMLPRGWGREERNESERAGKKRPGRSARFLRRVETVIAREERRKAEAGLQRRLQSRDRKVANLAARLKAERMRLSLILSSLAVAVVLTDRNGRLSLVNESARRMLGLPGTGALGPVRRGSPLRDLLMRMRQSHLTAVRSGRLGVEREEKTALRTLVAPLRDPGGSLWGTLGILEEPEMGGRLNELKSDFLSRVSHELKTPLSSIRAASDVIAQAKIGALNRKQEKMLRIITEETGNLVCLIEDLLDVSEIESGKIELRFRRCLLTEAARASLEHFRGRYREKGVALDESLAPDCPPVQADPRRLRQVFDNLLSNALKFTPAGGRVALVAKIGDRDQKEEKRRMVQASVSDTGIGIAPKDLERIFDRFHQTENLNTRVAGGSGLGLSISRFLVQAHGGELWVESHPGAGSTFFFTLPATR